MGGRRFLPVLIVMLGLAAVACAGASSSASVQPTPTPTPKGWDFVPATVRVGWDNTDFSKHTVSYLEIYSGGPGRDGVTPIDAPKFVEVADSPEYMEDNDPVIGLEIDGEAKAYPLAILDRHEIVNDDLAGVPVTVTFCPLCNSAIVFDRRVSDRVLDFGTTGFLRKSDLIMWDRQTESWWQQITGEAVVGELTGAKLKFIPAPVVSWADFRDAFPNGRLMSRDTGFYASIYDYPLYAGYDIGEFSDSDERDGDGSPPVAGEEKPFLFFGEIDPRLEAMERVAGIALDGQSVAYPFALLRERPVINDSVGGNELVIFYAGGTLTTFAGGLAQGRSVGSTAVYEPFVNGKELTFKAQGGQIVDEETGSQWNMLGRAVSGSLEGSQLAPVLHGNHFWFAWAAFNPDTIARMAEDLG